MAVMSTQLMDKSAFEAKPPPAASADMMVLDSDLNGQAHDTLFEETPAASELDPPPALNGDSNHAPPDLDIANNITNIKLDTDISTLPDAPSSIPPAIEAPISDVREMAADVTQSQLEVPPTQSTEQSQEATQPSTAPTDDNTTVVDPSVPKDSAIGDGEVELPDRTSDASPPAPLGQTTPGEADHEMADAPSSGKIRAREEDDEEDEDNEPLAKRTKVEDKPTPALETVALGVVPVGNGTDPAAPQTKSSMEPLWPSFDSEPITPQQQNVLLQRIRNARKIKAAGPFNKPVDPVALNIPNYPEIVKKPMDLATIENNLKIGHYTSVDDCLNDFNLMVRNCYAFNGREHPVSHLAADLERYVTNIFPAALDRNGAGSGEPKKPKKPTVATERKETRRKSFAAPPPDTVKSPVAAPAVAPIQPTPAPAQSTPTATSPTDRFALQPDGTPVIRRDSTTQDGRPKRQIQKPKPKDLPYSVKPKKKKFELELKFCEQILNEVRKQKHSRFNYPFLAPVDPVALNIPHYHKIVKKPMDISTIDKKLHQGEYSTSKEFKSDFDLMLTNCFKFNPETDEVHKMGRALQELLQGLWNDKDAWMEEHQPQSEPQSASADEDEDDDESSEGEPEDAHQRDLVAIQQQIAELTNRAQNIIQSTLKQRTSPKAKSDKKGKKSGKTGEKKKKGGAGGGAKVPSLKVKKTKVAPLSFAQKQEISETITTLDEHNMRKAVQIIRNGVPSLKGVNDEELEIDMDIIPDDVLRDLYKFLRGSRPKETKVDLTDDEYEMPRRGSKSATTKRKNKPMSKREQEENIRQIQKQLESFNNPGMSGDEQSPPAARDDSSSDDDGESESEEE